MDAAAMDRIAKHYYWSMWGAGRGAGAAGVRSSWPASHGGAGAEPSWEEQAFARDAAGHLGGCVWPPRSYTCSFCRREFRSAQALGGHMNVHRRDRARLRQGASSPDHDEPLQLQQPISLCGPHHRPPPDHQQPADFPLLLRLSSPKSIACDQDQQAAMATTCTASPNSCIATIIKESKNKAALFIDISMRAAATTIDGYSLRGGGDDDDSEEQSMEEIRRMKRRRVDLPAAAAAASCERPERRREVDPADAKVITSPSSSSALVLHQPQLVGRQEVDLELRLGTS
ncbi:hypothetical protein GUJ93_ZPchr0007g3578 [Zizania palustris]|uniref:C2H2-type domain-containing protein n=1 Tax=Zizania palustris TaxID=103762 RepID=A0A8J5SVI9_ZIZPA|nr:hypothetical protein GUJ93_ZPchr0007g3578 [Zizania palustris]